MRAAAAIALVLTLGCSSRKPHTAEKSDPPPAVEPLRIEGEPVEDVPAPAPIHPRLFIREADLPRLRGWATSANPMWKVLADHARQAEAEMDGGKLDCAVDWSPCEVRAEFFAFLSLVHPEDHARQAYAARAKKILLQLVAEFEKGTKERDPLRDEIFPMGDRARWGGEAFPVTVDWIYGSLSAEEKARIRAIFLRWAEQRLHATVTNHNHPEPVGALNDPALVQDRKKARWAGNNYFTSHMRLNGLAALAFDPADDPDGKLRKYLGNAIGAWLYMVDYLMRTDARGGLMPEGYEYSPQTLGYVAQLLLAIHTAGLEGKWKLASFEANPFWNDLLAVTHHGMSPGTVEHEWLGAVYQPAWFGDGQTYFASDPIDMFGPLGVYYALKGDAARLEAVRWIQREYPPGGAKRFPERVANVAHLRQAIFYFLLYDPAAPEPKDPRRALPLMAAVPGIGYLYARTSWERDATFVTYRCGWSGIDHQHAEMNQLELYRGGEWLTKERTGYGRLAACSDSHNVPAVENAKPYHSDPGDWRYPIWRRGSQWMEVGDGPCKLVASSLAEPYVHATGDATALYNSDYEGIHDVEHVSRSFVWVKPDHVVVLDRTATTKDGRFKRFFLNTANPAKVSGKRAESVTPKGQRFVVTALLPEDAVVTSEKAAPKPEEDEGARGEPMQHRVRIESPAHPKRVQFLTVFGAEAEPALLRSMRGPKLVGAVVAGTAVLFPEDPPFLGNGEVAYRVPAGVKRHIVTGLAPATEYHLSGDGDITVRPGPGKKTDEGGVLAWGF